MVTDNDRDNDYDKDGAAVACTGSIRERKRTSLPVPMWQVGVAGVGWLVEGGGSGRKSYGIGVKPATQSDLNRRQQRVPYSVTSVSSCLEELVFCASS